MDSGLCHFRAPNSPKGALIKRLVKSVSKTALKLASTISLRCRHPYPRSSSVRSPPPKACSQEEEQKSSEAMVRELCAVFKYFDGDGDGKISWVEMKSALNSAGEEVGENELREMTKELDSDGDGCIDEEEFIRLINIQKKGREEEEKELAAAFRMFEGEDGGITPMGLQRMMHRLGVGVGEGEGEGDLDDSLITLPHCIFIISQVDLDGDGVVNFNEFKRMMNNPFL